MRGKLSARCGLATRGVPSHLRSRLGTDPVSGRRALFTCDSAHFGLRSHPLLHQHEHHLLPLQERGIDSAHLAFGRTHCSRRRLARADSQHARSGRTKTSISCREWHRSIRCRLGFLLWAASDVSFSAAKRPVRSTREPKQVPSL